MDLKLIETILKAMPVKISRKFQCPGIAGYSKDGKTIYIDKRLPTHIDGIEIDPILAVHEIVEKYLIDKRHWTYIKAHDVATEAEKIVCEQYMPWEIYDKEMDRLIKEYEDFSGPLPHDLDDVSYEEADDEESKIALDKIRKLKSER